MQLIDEHISQDQISSLIAVSVFHQRDPIAGVTHHLAAVQLTLFGDVECGVVSYHFSFSVHSEGQR
jgi:hypothetical protein